MVQSRSDEDGHSWFASTASGTEIWTKLH